MGQAARWPDDETGLYYYGARYYDPKISIWLSVDPMAEKYPNFNPYVYCYQNPINVIDPTGMEGFASGGGGEPGFFRRLWNNVKSVFSSNKNGKSSIEIGEPTLSYLGATTLEAAETVTTAEATGAGVSAVTRVSLLSLLLMFNGDTRKNDESDDNIYLYRNMRPISEGVGSTVPMLGQSANTLGIRPADVGGRSFSEIISGSETDGLSSTIGWGNARLDTATPESVPNYGLGKTKLFRINVRDLLPLGLKSTQIKGNYYRITPLSDMTIQTFHERIQQTQTLWKYAPSNRK